MQQFFRQHRKLTETCNRVFGWIHRHNKVLFAGTACVALLLTVLFSGVVLAYRVFYNGEQIALIRSKNNYEEAVELVKEKVACDDLSGYTVSPGFSLALTTEDHLTTQDELADNIIAHTDAIFGVDGLYVDDQLVACLPREAHLADRLQEYLDGYFTADGETVSVFIKSVTVEPVFAVFDSLTDWETVSAQLESLDVQTTVTTVAQTVIPHETITRKTGDRPIGEVRCAVKGVDGLLETPTISVYRNGELIDVSTGEERLVRATVDEINVIGTRPSSYGPGASRSALNAVWPLKRTENQGISAYFGDGRNHKGVDIYSPYGTSILACQSGTVVTSEYSSSYGNYVVIRHGNGYETLYAHASRLYVSVGETVAQGQVIAAVGSTGNSTGNHLHFEVHYDGKALDPAPFLGLY